MDLDQLGEISLSWDFFTAFMSIVLIDLILAGDNAVVIAAAFRSLPRKQRHKGIMLGAGAAVLLRVVLTYFAAQLLQMSYVKLIGGLFILWIAVKLFVDSAPDEEVQRNANSILQALWVIVIESSDLPASLTGHLSVLEAFTPVQTILLCYNPPVFNLRAIPVRLETQAHDLTHSNYL